MNIDNLTTFMITALFFIMTPGIDTFFVLDKSINQGIKSGLYATLGINTGIIAHTLFTAIGLSTLLAASTFIFTCIKILGAAYLIHLGYTKYHNRNPHTKKVPLTSKHSTKNDFWSGCITNVLNPKVALFFLAFFPQFVAPNELDKPTPFLVLGLTYAIIGIVWYSILTLFAGSFNQKLLENPYYLHWLNKLSGIVMIVLGLKIAIS